MRRTSVIAIIVCLVTSSTIAQSPSSDRQWVRIRLTGQSGERVTGHARAVIAGVMEFVRDGDDGRITFVQMDAMRLIERGSRRAPRPLAIAAGAGAGVVGAVSSIIGGLVWCNDEHIEGSCWGLMQGLAFICAPILGGLLGWHLGRTNWTRIGAQELETLLARSKLL